MQVGVIAPTFGGFQRDGYCLLRGGDRAEVDELVYPAQRFGQVGRGEHVADLPAGYRKGFSGGIDGDGAFSHSRQSCYRDVFVAVVDHVLVHFVCDSQHIVVLAEVGD